MSSPPSLWSAKADELVADGEWHDGLWLAKEAEKAVPPGVAERKAERNRVRAGTRPAERKVKRPVATLIRIGRRNLIQQLFSARFREGAWVTDVPIPKDGWRTGGWKVRDVRAGRETTASLARIHHVRPQVIRELVLRDPPLEHQVQGKWMYVTDLAGLAERLAERRRGASERRSEGARRGAQVKASKPQTKVPLRDLARRAGMATSTARQLCEANPELPWEHRGRNTYLPVGEIPAWEAAVQKWREGARERRSRAAKEVRRLRREKEARGDGA